MIELLLFIFLGVAIGMIMGVIPGAHINNILPILLMLSASIQSQYMAVLIIATAMTEIFLNFIPSIFLGAPEEGTAMSVLPGHRLLLSGQGYEAIKLTVIGGVGSLITTIIIISILSPWFSTIYEITRPYVHLFIIAVTIFMIATEKKLKKIVSALLILLMSGLLGLISLGSSIVSQQNVLFPILTGMFGLSTLVVSISQRASIPKQNGNQIEISRKSVIKSIVLGSIAGVVVGFLPAIGISEAATMAQYVGGTGEAKDFLVTVSGINVGNEVFSLVSLFLVGNPRSGPSVAIQKIMTELTFFDVVLFVGVICFVSGIAAVLTLSLGKIIPRYLEKINYKKLCLTIIGFMIVMIFLLTGPFGLLIAFTSTSIGLLCGQLGARRSHCMGCLLIPSILFFSGLNPIVASILRI